METLGYKEFQQDVINTFKDLIKDCALIEVETEDFEANFKCILENSFCRLSFDLLKFFPRMLLTVDLFLKDQEGNSYLIEDYAKFLGIHNQTIDSYYSEYIKIKKPSDDLRGQILNELEWMYMLFLNLYFPIINGKLNYIHYEKWKKVIDANQSDKSYEDLFGIID